ncbi:nucleotidyltransferase family protein [Rhodococcus sp. KBS0724]|uniref:nucleotidyltransferase family protein n=1 Tax=Rhodococcus sp. KBS0724 TaxID=1179674 RepID=UPI00110EF79C|nr:nucleotidyltransferase family protein [Rhodococcus sp. KBS0724]TSD49548.1 nucleotidyltransferase family protein [Rhodococcus sp. KBS0724]
MSTCGILLAAGAGSRMGKPKALVTGADGQPWLRRGVTTLQSAGLSPVIVVLGAQAEDAVKLLPTTDVIVVISDWQHGMSASLRCGLEAAMEIDDADAAAISLVDVPDLNAGTVTRIVGGGTPARNVLRRAVFHGRPGHPVLIGRDHWSTLAESLTGDGGANTYLCEHGVELVECSDLSSGVDVDYPEA